MFLGAGEPPRLLAPIHNALTSQQLTQVPVQSLFFRKLDKADLSEVRDLHAEWFPLNYDDEFYERIGDGKLFRYHNYQTVFDQKVM